ncbi:MAG: FKBP-type peptidyl-prolyl cis-trans isomerase [Methanomicrobiaceae archaeon]|nr:FKBP-type peptidyl-prolyl cis-trans isomerase [Methanomicrobiaceae archaeon]
MGGVKEGDVVLVHFTSRTDDGEIFETSKEKEPSEIKIGEKKINPVFEELLIGMNHGERREVTLPAKKAYGEHKRRLVYNMRKSGLSLKYDPKPGDIVTIKLPTGQSSFVKVIEITKKSIKVDANHPMAGKDLTYELELVDIIAKN